MRSVAFTASRPIGCFRIASPLSGAVWAVTVAGRSDNATRVRTVRSLGMRNCNRDWGLGTRHPCLRLRQKPLRVDALGGNDHVLGEGGGDRDRLLVLNKPLDV